MELEGWWPAVRRLPKTMVFMPFPQKAKVSPGEPPIRLARSLVLVFGASLLLILSVLTQIGPWDGSFELPTGYIWLGTLIGSFPAIWWFRRQGARLLAQATTHQEVAAAYQTRMMLGIAFGEFAALVAFVLAFQLETLTPYLISLPIALITLWFVSPRDGDIRNVQRLIDERGGTVNLADALMGRV